jgi:hypothetical protein
LKEADGASEQLAIDSDDGATKPHDHKDNLKKEGFVVSIRGDGEHRGEHQTEKEGAPKVPVPYLFALVGRVCDGFDWVEHNPEFLSDPP